jgi:hypothetical protein
MAMDFCLMTALFDSFDLIEQILLFYDSLGFQQIYQSLLVYRLLIKTSSKNAT